MGKKDRFSIRCDKCGIPCRDHHQLSAHKYLRHKERVLVNDEPKGLSDPLLSGAPLLTPADYTRMYGGGSMAYPSPYPNLDTEQERIEFVTNEMRGMLRNISSTGPTQEQTKMLLELAQTREIMLANKEEIDGR